jgi:NAD(P)-dependent dehydrogenase (short-subunit alcohol dehydrogenase family)
VLGYTRDEISSAAEEISQARREAVPLFADISDERRMADAVSQRAMAYTATKAGQVAMFQQLALELARHHIRINAVCPGEIETNFDANTSLRKDDETAIPVVWPEGQVPITEGRPGRSEDVGEVIAFLASDRSRHVTGSPIWVDGGQGVLR